MDDLADIYRRHARAVFLYARSLTRNVAEAEDLVSQAFVRALVRRDVIRPDTVRGYLLTTVRHQFLNRLRRSGRETALDEDWADGAPAADRVLEGRRQADRLSAAMDLLGAGERRALQLRVEDGLSYERIGQALGLTADAAKMRVSRARARLTLAMSEQETPYEDLD